MGDSHPIPLMDECIDSFGESAELATVNANIGYLRVKVVAADSDKTGFTFHHGLYRFVRMPFGSKNVSRAFQRTMDVILSQVRWQVALVYLDYIVVF